ncbi:hypothetical protein [Hoylesella saccharolytica]|jgi:xre family toxin-antitoxin system, antitoxin component|uniref:hypothetical protein n=1 Tax=Hoylesella saccharolytica TaxID=633701 RepID=UPI000471CC87|nr:hypothetical protein [Hoylesella saccharolytica]DAR71625.1 MAG TPA: repressor protein C2 [Caudoviricetes sp.]
MKRFSQNKRWTKDDADYIQRHLGKESYEDMAAMLNRSPMSVRLYVLRKRLTAGEKVKRNLLVALLNVKFKHPEDFNPNRLFYQETGIGQRRYWDLYFGRKAITGKEYVAVATYFGITPDEAFESRQLDLFNE